MLPDDVIFRINAALTNIPQIIIDRILISFYNNYYIMETRLDLINNFISREPEEVVPCFKETVGGNSPQLLLVGCDILILFSGSNNLFKMFISEAHLRQNEITGEIIYTDGETH